MAIEHVFNDSSGSLLGFLRKSLTARKIFSKSNVKILELLLSLIKEYKWHIPKYSKTIVEVMLQYIPSSNASAKEKENTILILQELISNKLCVDVNISNLIKEVFQIFNSKEPPKAICKLFLRILIYIYRGLIEIEAIFG